MKTVSATMQISVYVNCPHCDYLIDLMDEDDTNGIVHNDDSYILKQAIPYGDWDESHREFEVDDVTCSHCKGSFDVKELVW